MGDLGTRQGNPEGLSRIKNSLHLQYPLNTVVHTQRFVVDTSRHESDHSQRGQPALQRDPWLPEQGEDLQSGGWTTFHRGRNPCLVAGAFMAGERRTHVSQGVYRLPRGLSRVPRRDAPCPAEEDSCPVAGGPRTPPVPRPAGGPPAVQVHSAVRAAAGHR